VRQPSAVHSSPSPQAKALLALRRFIRPEGSLKNNLPFSRPDLGQIWPIRLSETGGVAGYVEDFAIEDRPKMARRWDAKMASHASPVEQTGHKT
jgi:hypothetical protein